MNNNTDSGPPSSTPTLHTSETGFSLSSTSLSPSVFPPYHIAAPALSPSSISSSSSSGHATLSPTQQLLPQPQLQQPQPQQPQQFSPQKVFPRSVSTAAAAAAIITGNNTVSINSTSAGAVLAPEQTKHSTPITTHSVGIIGESVKTESVVGQQVTPTHIVTPTITTPQPQITTTTMQQPQPQMQLQPPPTLSSSTISSTSSSRKKSAQVIQATAAPTKVIGVSASLPSVGQTIGIVQTADPSLHSSHKHGSSKRNQTVVMNIPQGQVQMKSYAGYSIPIQVLPNGPMYISDRQALKAQQVMTMKMQQAQPQVQLQPSQQGYPMYKVNLVGKKTKKKRGHNEVNSGSEDDERVNVAGISYPKSVVVGANNVCNYPVPGPVPGQTVPQMMRYQNWMARGSSSSSYSHGSKNDEMTKKDHYILTIKNRYKLDFLSDDDDDVPNNGANDTYVKPPPTQRKKHGTDVRERWEECKAGGTTFYIPTVLMGKVLGKDGSGIKVLMKVLETAWKSPMRLAPTVKEDLKKYLPKGQEDYALEKIFSGENVNFGNPLRDFFYCLGRSAFESKYQSYRSQSYALRYANHLDALREYYLKFLSEAERYRKKVVFRSESKSLPSSGTTSPKVIQSSATVLTKSRSPQIILPQYSTPPSLQQPQQMQLQMQPQPQHLQIQQPKLQMQSQPQQLQFQLQTHQSPPLQPPQICMQIQQPILQIQVPQEDEKARIVPIETQAQLQSSFKITPAQVTNHKRVIQPHEMGEKAPFLLFMFLKNMFLELNFQPATFDYIMDRVSKNPVIMGDVPTGIVSPEEYIKLALWYLTNPPPFCVQYLPAPSQYNNGNVHGDLQAAAGPLKTQIQLQPQPQPQQSQPFSSSSSSPQFGASFLEYISPCSWRWVNPIQPEEDSSQLEKRLQEMEQLFTFAITRHFFNDEKTEISYTLLRNSKGAQTLQPTPAPVLELFHMQEKERYANPDAPYMYTGLCGIGAVVPPIRASNVANQAKPRAHHLLSNTRPWCVSILSLVRDSVARLPGGIGTRADVTRLFCESQYVVATNVDMTQVPGIVNGALDRLQAEPYPSVKFDSDNKLWTYLHRHYTLNDFLKKEEAI